MVQRKNDRKWNEERADEEVQDAVMYRPDLTTLPSTTPPGTAGDDLTEEEYHALEALEDQSATGAGTGTRARNEVGSEVIELAHREGGGSGLGIGSGFGGREEEEEPLPEYVYRRPRNQPMIVDTTHPPRRLAGAVARRIQSESATYALTIGPSSEPVPQETQTTIAVPTCSAPPPPGYTP